MTDERSRRDLVPRPAEPPAAVEPRESGLPATVSTGEERFYAGDQAHTVGLSEERAAQIVKQSGNARMVAFLGALFFVLFIPLYWLLDIGLPVVGYEGRLEAEAEQQQVRDISRGYALYLANCARCHGNTGGGGVGPVLNDQAKLYNTLTEQGLSGPGHLNPEYLQAVLSEGGRYVCGDPNSAMPAWLEPKGPLNYKEVEDIIAFITASKDTKFVYQPAFVEPPATVPPPVTVEGWRDPAYTPAPDATEVPDCWRAPSLGGGGQSSPGTSPAASAPATTTPVQSAPAQPSEPAGL